MKRSGRIKRAYQRLSVLLCLMLLLQNTTAFAGNQSEVFGGTAAEEETALPETAALPDVDAVQEITAEETEAEAAEALEETVWPAEVCPEETSFGEEAGEEIEPAGGTYYESYIPVSGDDYAALKNKQVSFNGIDWYIISDNSTGESDGFVTLFAVNPIGVSQFDANLRRKNIYQGSLIEGFLKNLTESNGAFFDVADVIRNVDLTDVGVTGAKLYLLSLKEAEKLPVNVKKCNSLDGAESNFWWLRTPSENNEVNANVVHCEVGETGEEYVIIKQNVRPALQLYLPSVSFSAATKTFQPKILEYHVNFRVVNGEWDDGTTADRTVSFSKIANTDLVLTLSSDQIPAVGNRPWDGYKKGGWDISPAAQPVISGDKTFTYTYGENPGGTGLGTGAITHPVSGNTPGLTGWTGSYVYYGKYEGTPVRYRVLDPEATEFGGNTMLLDCDSVLYIGRFNDNNSTKPSGVSRNDWRYSDLKSGLNGDHFLTKDGCFTETEKTSLAESTKREPASGDGSGGGTNLLYCPLSCDRVFVLDAMEITRPSYGYVNARNVLRKLASYFLRSPYKNSGFQIGYFNGTDLHYAYVDTYTGVSPAFNLRLPSVLLSTVISGNAGEQGADYKLTVSDSKMTVALTEGKSVSRNGNVVTVPYAVSGEHAASANRISVLVLDRPYQAGQAVSDGVICRTLKTVFRNRTGTGTFTLPEQYSSLTCGRDYFVYILAKNVRSEYETDEASAPVEITVPNLPGPEPPGPQPPGPEPPGPEPPDPSDPDSEIQEGDLPPGTQIPSGVWIGGLKRSYPYTGSAIKPDFRVYFGSRRLTPKTEYTLSYRNNKKSGGTAQITIRMKGDFTGAKTVCFTVSKNDLAANKVSADLIAVAFKNNKKNNTVKPVLMMSGNQLKYGADDFDIRYLDMQTGQESTCAGKGNYLIRMTAKGGNYTGTIDVPLTVTDAILMSRVKINPSKSSFRYNGTKQMPSFRLTFGGREIAPENYKIEESVWDDYTEPGKHSLKFIGNGKEVCGVRTFTYQITGKRRLGDSFTVISVNETGLDGQGLVPYSYGGAKPSLKVTYKGEKLKEGRDYTVSYRNNKKAGSAAKAVLKGKGSYAGTGYADFTVSQRDLNSMLLFVSDRVYSTRPKDYEKTQILFTDSKFRDQKLVRNRDYAAEFKMKSGEIVPLSEAAGSGISPGESIFTVTLKMTAKDGGNYKGEVQTTYRIIGKSEDIFRAAVTVSGGRAIPYTGRAVTPSGNAVKAVLDGKEIPGSQYELSWYNNTDRGNNAVLLLKGKDGMKNIKPVKFKIRAADVVKDPKVWCGVIYSVH